MEANKQVVRDYVAAFNAGDFDAVRALFAPDGVVHGVLGWGGLEVALPVWRDLHEGFSMRMAIEALVAEGDVVAARFTETGHFVRPFRGAQPTGKTYELVAMEFFEFEDGRIKRRWGARDSASQARQLGL